MNDETELRKRIEIVETQNRRTKLALVVLTLLFASALTLNLVRTFGGGVSNASEFVMKDQLGNILAKLSSDGWATCLLVTGGAKGAHASLCAGDDAGASLMLDNVRGESRAFLSTGTMLREGPGSLPPGLIITHANGRNVVTATVGEESRLIVGHVDGENSVVLSSDKGKPSIRVSGDGQKPLWKVP
jgi:hypothetical protein